MSNKNFLEEEYDDDSFEYYQEDTIDPGPAMLMITILFSFTVLAILPVVIKCCPNCLNWLVRCATEEAEDEETGLSMGQQKNHELLLNQTAESLDSYNLKEHHRQQDPDAASVASTSSSVAQAVIQTILTSSNPHAGPHPNRLRSQVERYHEAMSNDTSSFMHDEVDHVLRQQQLLNTSGMADSVASEKMIKEITTTNASTLPTNNLTWWQLFLLVCDYDKELHRIITLTLPFVTDALVRGLMESVNVALIGHFVGTGAVSAYVTVHMVVGLAVTAIGGFYESLTTLCSQAIGAKQKRLAGQYVQLAVVLYLLAFVPLMVVLVWGMEGILRWFGFEEDTVQQGVEYNKVYLFLNAVGAVSGVTFVLLDVIEQERYSMWASIIEEVLSTFSAFLVVMVHDGPTLWLIGIVFLVISCLCLMVNMAIIMYNGWFDEFLGGMVGSCALSVR